MMEDFTLLYAEDDIETLEDTKFLLKRDFSKIYTALDGEKALALYLKYKPDVIILDINMPKLSGLQVAAKIKKLDENVQIIFLTANSQIEIKEIINSLSLHYNKCFNTIIETNNMMIIKNEHYRGSSIYEGRELLEIEEKLQFYKNDLDLDISLEKIVIKLK